jgi:hypothetical protein
VPVLTLGITILLVRVWARHTMGYTYFDEEGIEPLIFSTPIGLNGYDLSIQETLNMLLKQMKCGKHFRFMF